MRREREPACPGEPGLDSCTTNHSGNRHAPIPRCRSCQCSGSDGGVYSRGSCTPVMEVSLDGQTRLFDRFQVGLGAPGVEPAHDGGFVWQVDQGSRPERGDDLAAPQLPVRLAVHSVRPPRRLHRDPPARSVRPDLSMCNAIQERLQEALEAWATTSDCLRVQSAGDLL